MSQKIPFLQMFAALRRWTELSNADFIGGH